MKHLIHIILIIVITSIILFLFSNCSSPVSSEPIPEITGNYSYHGVINHTFREDGSFDWWHSDYVISIQGKYQILSDSVMCREYRSYYLGWATVYDTISYTYYNSTIDGVTTDVLILPDPSLGKISLYRTNN